MKVVQNQKPDIEDIKPVIDKVVVNKVHEIFEAVIKLNSLDNLFEDYASRLIEDLSVNSFMEYNLELRDEQKDQLRKVVKIRGYETVRSYLANLNNDTRAKDAYDVAREKTAEIADAVLSSIGKEINRGAIINCYAVQANSKSKDHDEILLRKSKSSGDITIPTSCVLLSTNCVEVIKASCQTEKEADEKEDSEEDVAEGEQVERVAADRPARVGK
jgi:hypothetical protein